MSRIIGIIGLPNVGKSTIFNILIGGFANAARAEVSNYPFCTIEPNIGQVYVPDERLAKLNQLISPKETKAAAIKFMDLAGLIKGSSKGEGLGNRFLAHAREADALLHVVRCFEDRDIAHVSNGINPERDIDIINTELCLSDLEIAEKRLEKIIRLAKSGDKNALREISLLEDVIIALQKGEAVRGREISLPFLSIKPVVYLANIGERNSEKSDELFERVSRKVSSEKAVCLKIAAKLESELKKLSGEEELEFRKEWLGETAPPLERLLAVCYGLLNLITFYTIAGDKVFAWSIERGEKISRAAGKIHSDMEKGFIKAEVINFERFKEIGSFNIAMEKGCVRVAGKDYIVQDGDIIFIHFLKI